MKRHPAGPHFLALTLLLVPATASAPPRSASATFQMRTAAPTSIVSWQAGPDAFGGYGGPGYYSGNGGPLAVPPKYWWVSPYNEPPIPGDNPNAGYDWDTVGVLILETTPPAARVTLDGIYAGTADKLGPFQLPLGEHTFLVEAPGYEPRRAFVAFGRPGVRQLAVALKRAQPSSPKRD